MGRNRIFKKSQSNQRVKNAIPSVVDGIKFRSKLEVFTYLKLKEAGLDDFRYENKKWIIQEGFEYMGEKVRPITLLPDFYSLERGIIIEVKGYPTDSYKLKLKLFKRHLFVNRTEYTIYHVNTQKSVLKLIQELTNVQDTHRAS